MRVALMILAAVVVMVAAFKYVDYKTGSIIKEAQLGALGL